MTETVFILSAPSPNQQWDNALAPLEGYSGLQSLLGWDAQLKIFGAMLQQAGATCLVTPAPEIFFTPTSWEVAARSGGLAAPDLNRTVHIRFGGGRFGRVLRGVKNFLATAEREFPGVLAPGGHPFRDQNTAPHAMRRLLDLSGAAGPFRRPDGSEIARIPVPDDLIGADLPEMALTARPLKPPDFEGLELCTLAEFAPPDWRSAFQTRRLMLEFNAHGLALPKPLILLPWNLANPAGSAPDLALKYFRAMGQGAGYLVLLPFNASRAVKNELRPQAAALAGRMPAEAEKNLFIARVTDIAAVTVLRRLGAVAWLDEQDCEAAWTRNRFAACAISVVKLAAGERVMAQVRDEFGLRFMERWQVPQREIRHLAAQPGAIPPRPAVYNAVGWTELLNSLSANG
jgi:hypothetical protein